MLRLAKINRRKSRFKNRQKIRKKLKLRQVRLLRRKNRFQILQLNLLQCKRIKVTPRKRINLHKKALRVAQVTRMKNQTKRKNKSN